jgi:hypothetical protein
MVTAVSERSERRFAVRTSVTAVSERSERRFVVRTR